MKDFTKHFFFFLLYVELTWENTEEGRDQPPKKKKKTTLNLQWLKINKTVIAWHIIAWETNYEKEADVQAD